MNHHYFPRILLLLASFVLVHTSNPLPLKERYWNTCYPQRRNPHKVASVSGTDNNRSPKHSLIFANNGSKIENSGLKAIEKASGLVLASSPVDAIKSSTGLLQTHIITRMSTSSTIPLVLSKLSPQEVTTKMAAPFTETSPVVQIPLPASTTLFQSSSQWSAVSSTPPATTLFNDNYQAPQSWQSTLKPGLQTPNLATASCNPTAYPTVTADPAVRAMAAHRYIANILDASPS